MTASGEAAGAHALALVRDALLEAQANVRAYDTKAQIVGVGYIFALGIVDNLEPFLPAVDEIGLAAVVLTWTLVIMPILLYGHVLYPSRRVAPDVERDAGSRVRHILYSDPDDMRSVEQLRQSALVADPVEETCFELMKVSRLRDIKRRRFLRALFATLIAFAFLFTMQMARVAFA